MNETKLSKEQYKKILLWIFIVGILPILILRIFQVFNTEFPDYINSLSFLLLNLALIAIGFVGVRFKIIVSRRGLDGFITGKPAVIWGAIILIAGLVMFINQILLFIS